MHSTLRRVTAACFSIAVSCPLFHLCGQQQRPDSPHAPMASYAAVLPDAPQPRLALAGLEPQSTQVPGQSSQSQRSAPIPGSSSPNSSSSDTYGPVENAQSQPSLPTPSSSTAPDIATPSSPSFQSDSDPKSQPQQTRAQKSQHQLAAEQIRRQEHQRVAGILPSFNVSYVSDAAPMTAAQKMSLAFRSATDPFPFGVAVLVTGYSEVREDNAGFGWGLSGYFKRSGAAYLDEFNGTMIGNGILPAILHQDPRYFRLGHGSVRHRLFYAIATSYICKHDKSRRWEPNYSNVGGNIIAGGISTLYYPSGHTGWDQTITDGFLVTTEGTVGGVLNEFWPDISRKLFHKDPTNGLDAQLAIADRKKKGQE